jgi:large subunit ribosomal protein L21
LSGYQAEVRLLPTRARLYREAGATSLKHAIIVTGGKQYRVAEGDVIFVEKLDVEAGETVKFDRVLAVIDEDKAVFGTPVVENAVVSGNVVKNGKSKKIRVYKMKPKKGYRRSQGHRQPYTKVEITKIEA